MRKTIEKKHTSSATMLGEFDVDMSVAQMKDAMITKRDLNAIDKNIAFLKNKIRELEQYRNMLVEKGG